MRVTNGGSSDFSHGKGLGLCDNRFREWKTPWFEAVQNIFKKLVARSKAFVTLRAPFPPGQRTAYFQRDR